LCLVHKESTKNRGMIAIELKPLLLIQNSLKTPLSLLIVEKKSPSEKKSLNVGSARLESRPHPPIMIRAESEDQYLNCSLEQLSHLHLHFNRRLITSQEPILQRGNMRTESQDLSGLVSFRHHRS